MSPHKGLSRLPRRWGDNLGIGATILATALGMGLIVAVFALLAHEAAPALVSQGLRFFLRSDWDVSGNRFGALHMFVGSALVGGLALLLAVPMALAAALLAAEFVSPRARLLLKGTMELLAGIPSVVIGLIGIWVIVPAVAKVFGLPDGRTLFTGGLVLSAMILPTVMTISEDALRSVPHEFRENAWALGLTRTQTAFSVVLPQAAPGLLGATLLGLGRALGETIAVMLLVGSLDRMPQPLYNLLAAGQTVTSKLGREVAEAAFGSAQYHALTALGLSLMLITLALTLAAESVTRRVTRAR